MLRTTTVVCLVGFPSGSAAAIARLGSNVGHEAAPELGGEPLSRQDVAWSVLRAARRRNAVYTLIEIDPMESVVDAWGARLRGEEHDLEMMIRLVPDDPLPEYYLVAPDYGGDTIHWYLDLCYRRADRRIVVVDPSVDAAYRTLGHLPIGPELPGARDLAAAARTYVPPTSPQLTPTGSSDTPASAPGGAM